MEKEPYKFSVLMASFNNGPYIGEAIESVLAQSYQNWELVIVDDASHDNSVEVIKPYLKDKRIMLFHHEKNFGCGRTKRDCALHSTGCWLGILDSDDVLDNRALALVADVYKKNTNVGVVYTNYYECDENLRTKRRSPWAGEMDIRITNLKKSFTSHFLTFKRSVYLQTDGFDARQLKAVDKDIIYKLEEVADFLYLDEPLYYYRMHRNSISLGKNEQLASAYAITAKYAAFMRRRGTGLPNYCNREMADILIMGSLKFFFFASFRKGLLLLARSVKLDYRKLPGRLFFMVKFVWQRLWRKFTSLFIFKRL